MPRNALPFDLETAISVCRRGGFAAQAAYLARTYGEHDEYLRIQLQDEHNVAEAIDYLTRLPPGDAVRHVQVYARVLLDEEPQRATDLLIELYTHPISDDGDYATPEPLYPHFVGHPASFCRFLEALAERRWGKQIGAADDTDANADADADRTTHIVPMTAPDNPTDETSVFDTLLELYLCQMHAPDKALYILKHPGQYAYTQSQALLLCATDGFADGLLYLYEQLGMVEETMQYWIDQTLETDANDSAASEHASNRVLDVLDRCGEEDTNLYIMALHFLTSRESILRRHADQFHDVLNKINELGLLNTLEVVQLVSQTGVVEVGMMSTYLLQNVRTDRAELSGVNKLIESYRNEAAAKETELEELTSSTVPRSFQNRRCDACSGTLDLPKVHFMCKHSFHLRCLGDGDAARECPVCARAQGIVQDVQSGNAMLQDYGMVLETLHESDDGFGAVADLFAKGLLERE